MGLWSASCNTTLHLEKTPPAPTEEEAGWAAESVWVPWKREQWLIACARDQTEQVNTVFTNYMKQPFFISTTEWQEELLTYKTFNLNLSMCGLFIVS